VRNLLILALEKRPRSLLDYEFATHKGRAFLRTGDPCKCYSEQLYGVAQTCA